MQIVWCYTWELTYHNLIQYLNLILLHSRIMDHAFYPKDLFHNSYSFLGYLQDMSHSIYIQDFLVLCQIKSFDKLNLMRLVELFFCHQMMLLYLHQHLRNFRKFHILADIGIQKDFLLSHTFLLKSWITLAFCH